MTTKTLAGSKVNIHKDGETTEAEMMFTAPDYAFAILWNELNEKRGFGWQTNPFVWCLTFKRLSNARP
jgi:hypothetical protein